MKRMTKRRKSTSWMCNQNFDTPNYVGKSLISMWRYIQHIFSYRHFIACVSLQGNKSARIRTTRNRMKSLETEPKKDSDSHKKEHGIFGNLHGIIDSEESENEYSNKETEQRRKRPKLIESDEES